MSTASLTYEFEHWRLKKFVGGTTETHPRRQKRRKEKQGEKKTDTKQVGKIDIEEGGRKRRKEEEKKTDNTAKACCRDR